MFKEGSTAVEPWKQMDFNSLWNELTAPERLPALILSILLTVNMIIFLVLNRRMATTVRRYNQLLSGAEGENIESVLNAYFEATQSLTQTMSIAMERIDSLETDAKTHMQRIGLVRYNAFDNVGGEQSFSVAILDDMGSGMVLTSLYGRDETRAYAKPVKGGLSTYTLSEEEIQAIARALEIGKRR